MRDEHFIDTSVLVYFFDDTDSRKHSIGLEFLSRVDAAETRPFLSSQVLGELYNVLTRKIASPMQTEQAVKIVKSFIDSNRWSKLNYTHATIGKALLLSSVYKVPIWDSVIAETARENGITTIMTENAKHFRRIPGIKAINPFR